MPFVRRDECVLVVARHSVRVMKNHLVRLVSPALLAVLFTFTTFGTAESAEAQPGVAQVGQALLEFSGALRDEYLSPPFRNDLDAWVASVRAARTGRDLARALAALEEGMTWESVGGEFGGMRNRWVAELNAASTPEQVAPLLIQLQDVTRWEALAESWRSRQAGWVASLRRGR